MFFIDSHCHLNLPKIAEEEADKDRTIEIQRSATAIIDRAHKANVKYMLTIGTELSDVEEIKTIANGHENIFRSVGIHPQEAQKHYSQFQLVEIEKIIKEHCSLPKTVAIGEIGLDYYFERETEAQQKEIFRLQMALAKEFKTPVVIHSRNAVNDTIDILREFSGTRGVIHCFSGEKDFAKKSLDLGFYISISGIVTFKSGNELREAVKFIPYDRLLIETDSPFLAPVPLRGKTNEPSFIPYIAQKIAEIKGMDIEKVAEETSNNFFELFNKATNGNCLKLN